MVIGSIIPLTLPTQPFNVQYYLGISVGTDAEMTPRQPLVAAPYAIRSAVSDTLASTAPVGGAQITGTINTGMLPTSNLIGAIGTAQIAGNAVTQAQIADSAVPQAKLLVPSGTAANGMVLGTNGSNLMWQAAGSGTVTSVGTGGGLSGGPIIGSGTISLAGTQLLPTTACSTNQIPKWTGSAWGCATVDIAAAGGLAGQVLAGTGAAPAWTSSPSLNGNVTLPHSTSLGVGNIMKVASPSNVPFLHDYGNGNTFVGVNAGNFTMTSSVNLNLPVTGAYNTGVGGNALYANTTGAYNTAVGLYALTTNKTGGYNTALGQGTLQLNDSGSFNTAVGQGALVSNTTGNNNVALGQGALQINQSGSNNTASGSQALAFNTTGGSNTAGGYEALYRNNIGGGNTASGFQALQYNTTGNWNTASGAGALANNTVGHDNTAVGATALA